MRDTSVQQCNTPVSMQQSRQDHSCSMEGSCLKNTPTEDGPGIAYFTASWIVVQSLVHLDSFTYRLTKLTGIKKDAVLNYVKAFYDLIVDVLYTDKGAARCVLGLDEDECLPGIDATRGKIPSPAEYIDGDKRNDWITNAYNTVNEMLTNSSYLEEFPVSLDDLVY